MIVDALRAELYKLSRNRGSAFWAFGFMPLFALGAGLIEQAFVHFYIGDIIPYASPLQDSLSGLASFSVSIFQICGIAGAAIIFAGEYRWETWRASLTRVDRIAAMAAKMMAFALAISASLILCSLARMVVGFIDAGLTGSATWPPVGVSEILLAHLVAFAASFLQIMVTAAFVMLVAVVSRAMTASIVATVLTLVACEIASIRGNAGGDPIYLLFPNIAGDAIRQAGQMIMLQREGLLAGFAPMAVPALVIEFLLLSGAATALFVRQDLSKE
jgi:ABC-2 type transport system permease protein